MRMPNYLYLLAGLLLLSINVNAQLLVEESGNAAVGVEYDIDHPLLSKFSVGDRGNSNYFMTVSGSGKNSTLKLTRSGGVPYTDHMVIDARNTEMFGLTTNYGIYTTAYSPTLISGSCSSYGLYAVAGNCETGNYGALGLLYGTGYGTGVYGSSSTAVVSPGSTKYAGYFFGNVYATGTIQASNISAPSDYRLKDNIHSLAGNNVLDNVLQLNVVGFNYKQRELDCVDSIGLKVPMYDEDSPILKNEHFGFIAQELKEIYPNLVTEGGDGYLSVNYIEIIPLLVQSIQELEARLKDLEQKDVRKQSSVTLASVPETEKAILFQNTPNPFREETKIGCTIPSNAMSALLLIYDMTGKQLVSTTIVERGNTEVTIKGKSLIPGMYMYSLVVDDIIIDTKRMILTK